MKLPILLALCAAFLAIPHPSAIAQVESQSSSPEELVLFPFDDNVADNVLGGTGRDYLILGSGDSSDLAKNEV